MAKVVRVARGVGLLTSLIVSLICVIPSILSGAEYVVSPLLPTTLGGKTLWVDVTEKAGSNPYQEPGTSFKVVLTATAATSGTFTAPASPGHAARSGTWTAGFTGSGSVQQPGNYLYIDFTGLHEDAVVDNFTFYPAYSGPSQIPCLFYMYRGTVVLPIDAVDYQRGYVRVTDGEAPAAIAPKFNSVIGGGNRFTGSSPALSVNVLGTFPLTYQWSKGATALPYGTNATLVLTNIQVADAGEYTILVSNSAGSISSNLTVTVTQSVAPTISVQPQDTVVFSNRTAFLSVTADGTFPLVYQWRKDGVPLAPDAFNAGTTNAQLAVYNFHPTNAGSYDIVITNYAGSITSAVAQVTLGTAPVLISGPASTNVIQGETLVLSATATGPSIGYAWYKGTTLVAAGVNNTYTKANVLYADRGDYSVQVVNTAGTVTSAVAKVEIYIPTAPFYYSQLPQITTNQGANVTFTGLFYSVPSALITWKKNGINIPGATGLAPNVVSNFTDHYSFFTLNNVGVADIASYSVVASNSVGSAEIPAVNLVLSLPIPPVLTFQPTNQTLFDGDSAALRIGFVSQTASVVRWYSNSVLTTASATNYAPVLNTPGNYDYYATVSNAVGVSTSLTARVTVKIRPGTLDANFNPTTIDGAVNALAPQTDGKVIIGGAFQYIGSSNRNRLTRLQSNGTLDSTWTAAANTLNAAVYTLAQQADGKLLVGGDFTLIGTAPARRYSGLLRLNSAGALDTTFLCGTTDGSLAFSNSVKAIAFRADGYFAAAGKFTNVLNNLQTCVALFDSEGAFQTGFRPVFSAPNLALMSVDALAFQADGKLLVGGVFTSIGGTARTYLARLTSTGTLDTTFNASPGSSVRSVLALSDGRLFAGGASPSQISRYSSTGAFDNVGFGQGVGGGTGVYALAQQPGGQVLIGGDYTSSISTPNHGYLVRVKSDGALDPGFKAYPNASVNAIANGADGSIWVAGNFSSILPSGTQRSKVAKLVGEAPPVPAPAFGTPLLVTGALRVQFLTANGRNYQLEMKPALGDAQWTFYQAVAGDGATKTVDIPAAGGAAFFRINLLPE